MEPHRAWAAGRVAVIESRGLARMTGVVVGVAGGWEGKVPGRHRKAGSEGGGGEGERFGE